jgi:hypothetical protein
MIIELVQVILHHGVSVWISESEMQCAIVSHLVFKAEWTLVIFVKLAW